MRLFLPLAAAAALFAQAPGIEGNWQGTLNLGAVKLRLAVHIKKDASGKLTSTIDSIDQGANGIPVAATMFSANVLHLDIPAIHGTFDGKLNQSGSQIKGTFTQGAGLPLTFERVEKVAELNRPQTPKPPFPYRAIDVEYANGAIQLAGTLTVPQGAGPFPAALLITGSGPQDRDESLMGHKPFWIIADHLSRHGVAVLRVDDRGVGKSSGKSSDETIQEMASDVLSGIAFLKTRGEVDPRRIGVIGHSEGGIVGPMAASESPDIAFVVMLAGPGVTGEQVLYLQADLVARSMGAGDAAIAANRKIQELIFRVLRDDRNNNDREAVIAHLRQAWKVQQGSDAPPAIEAQFQSITSPELRSFLFHDPADALKKVKVPVLAMNGSRDVQVPPRQNLPAIVATLTAAGNPDVTAVELPGLNHLFQHCKKCSPTEYGEIEETFAPEALDVMTDWIARHTHQ